MKKIISSILRMSAENLFTIIEKNFKDLMDTPLAKWPENKKKELEKKIQENNDISRRNINK